MRFHLSLLALVAAAVAQQNGGTGNAFNVPSTGTYLLTAGQPQTFTWSNKVGNTVTLILRTGSNGNLNTVQTIASNIQNSGTYTWDVPSTIPEGADYAVEIVNDQDTSQYNYTPQFVIQSNVKAVQTSGGTTSMVTATSPSASSGASMTATSDATATGSSSATATHSGSASGSASASSTSKPSGASGSAAPAPTTGGAQSLKAGSGLLAVAAAFAIIL